MTKSDILNKQRELLNKINRLEEKCKKEKRIVQAVDKYNVMR